MIIKKEFRPFKLFSIKDDFNELVCMVENHERFLGIGNTMNRDDVITSNYWFRHHNENVRESTMLEF